MWWNCFSEVALVLGDHLGILSVRIHEKLSKVECKHFSHWSYLRSCILRLDQGLKSLIQSISYRSFPLCHNKKTTLYALSDLLSDWYVIPVGRSGKAIRGFPWHLRGSGWQLPEIGIEICFIVQDYDLLSDWCVELLPSKNIYVQTMC